MKLNTSILCCLLAVFSCAGLCASGSKTAALVVSSHFSEDMREELRDDMLKFLLVDAPDETDIIILDGSNGSVITRISIPELSYDGPSARRKAFGKELGKLLTWFAQKPPAEVLADTGALDVPLAFASLDRLNVDSVLLIGSPIYRSAAHPDYSWHQAEGEHEGYWYPSDAFFFASSGASPWTVSKARKRLSGVDVHWLLTGDVDFESGSYEAAVRRFYGLFCQLEGGQLVSFISDSRTAYQDVFRNDLTPEVYTLNSRDTALSMRRARSEVIFDAEAHTEAEVVVPLNHNLPPVQRIVCVDITSSMGKVFPFVARTVSLLPPDKNTLLITYADYEERQVVNVFEESKDMAAISRSLRAITLLGGGDAPEALGEALRKMNEELAVRRVAEPVEILIWTDALPKAVEDSPTGVDWSVELDALIEAKHNITLYRVHEGQDVGWVPDGVTIRELNENGL